MKNFKIGDEVWFFYTQLGQNKWMDGNTIVMPDQIELIQGKIINANSNDDYVHIYIKGEQLLLTLSFTFFDNYVFKTKQDAINGMIKSMQEL